jgi:hypothetical protein
VTTVLTVGFGDLHPTSTAARIVLFPFTILLIAQLANIIGMTARFFGERTRNMQEDWQRNIERRHHERRDAHNPTPDLTEELAFLEKIYRQVEMKEQLREISVSIAVFLTFWLIGAIIFWKIEVILAFIQPHVLVQLFASRNGLTAMLYTFAIYSFSLLVMEISLRNQMGVEVCSLKLKTSTKL